MSETIDTKTSNPNQPRNDFYIGGALVLLGIGLLIWQVSWVRAVFRGPRPIAEAELGQYDDNVIMTDDYISFEATDLVETGLVVKKKSRIVSRYVLVSVGDRWALASLPEEHEGNRIVGYLKRLDSWDSKGITKALDETRAKFPDHQLTSYYFSASKDQTSEVWALLGLIGFFTLGGGALCLCGLARWKRRPSE